MPLAPRSVSARPPRRSIFYAIPQFAASRAGIRRWTILAVVLGLLLRFSRYLFDEALYCDEVSIVFDNLLNRDFAGLGKPLVEDQVAPIGFLLAVQLAAVLFGVSEYAFRLVPLLAGLTSVILFYCLAKRILDPVPAMFSVVLFGACWHLANYSHFVKQYASDVALASAILLVAVTQQREALRRPAALIGWSVSGAIAVWCSHPAIFILAGVAAAWAIRELSCEGRRSWRMLAIGPAVWGGSFLAQYWLVLRHNTANRNLLEGHSPAFMPLPPVTLSEWLWVPKALAGVFADIDGTPAGRYLAVLSVGLALAGSVRLFRANRFNLTLFVVPIAAALAASGLRKYPFAHRLVHFLYPALILLLCAGLDWVLLRWGKRTRVVALLPAIILGPVVAKGLYGLATQPATHDIKPLLRHIAEEHRNGDLVWVDTSAGGAFLYYRDYASGYAGYPLSSVCMEDCHKRSSDPSAYQAALERAVQSRRLWVLFSYIGSAERAVEQQLLERLDSRGSRAARFERRGVALTLYEFHP